MINLPDDISIHVYRGYKLMDIYDKTTGFPRLDNELLKDGADRDGDITANLKAVNLDKEWAKNRNREIEKEVDILREQNRIFGTYYLDKWEQIAAIDNRIKELLEERDKNTYKYGLAGKEFERLYLEKQHRPEVNGENRFRFITEEMTTLYSQKNTDYGDAFTESLDEDGLLVSKIRLKDKLKRFAQLIENDALVNDESMRDTLIDMANYAVMTMMWLDDNEKS